MGFCPQSYSYRRGHLSLVISTLVTQDAYYSQSHTGREILTCAQRALAQDAQQMAPLLSLSSHPSLKRKQRPGESGEGGVGGRPLQNAGNERSFLPRRPQAPSPAEPFPSGPRQQNREETTMGAGRAHGGAAEAPRTPCRGSCCLLIASITDWGWQKAHYWGLLDRILPNTALTVAATGRRSAHSISGWAVKLPS